MNIQCSYWITVLLVIGYQAIAMEPSTTPEAQKAKPLVVVLKNRAQLNPAILSQPNYELAMALLKSKSPKFAAFQAQWLDMSLLKAVPSCPSSIDSPDPKKPLMEAQQQSHERDDDIPNLFIGSSLEFMPLNPELWKAVRSEIIQALVKGADPNLTLNLLGYYYTSLTEATRYNDLSLVQELFDRGADFDSMHGFDYWYPPAKKPVICLARSPEVVQKFMAQGVPVDAGNGKLLLNSLCWTIPSAVTKKYYEQGETAKVYQRISFMEKLTPFHLLTQRCYEYLDNHAELRAKAGYLFKLGCPTDVYECEGYPLKGDTPTTYLLKQLRNRNLAPNYRNTARVLLKLIIHYELLKIVTRKCKESGRKIPKKLSFIHTITNFAYPMEKTGN